MIDSSYTMIDNMDEVRVNLKLRLFVPRPLRCGAVALWFLQSLNVSHNEFVSQLITEYKSCQAVHKLSKHLTSQQSVYFSAHYVLLCCCATFYLTVIFLIFI